MENNPSVLVYHPGCPAIPFQCETCRKSMSGGKHACGIGLNGAQIFAKYKAFQFKKFGCVEWECKVCQSNNLEGQQ